MRNQPILLFGDTPILIKQDQTVSNVMDFRRLPLRGITVFGPAILVGTDVAFEVTYNLNAEVPDEIRWLNLQSGGANIKISAGEAVPVDFVCWQGLRFVSDTIETTEVEFVIMGVEDI